MRIFLLFIFLPFSVLAQNSVDSASSKSDKLTYRQFVLPAASILAGTLLRHSKANQAVKDFRDREFGNFQSNVDDYLQYTPAALMLLGNHIGFKSVNSNRQMLANMLVSNLLISAVVLPLKHTIRDWRPDGSTANSFPSGHSAAAASAATLHFLEYKDDNIWYASSVMLVGATTGFMRILNNRHWLSDVLAGGGIGVATAVVTFYTKPLKWRSREEKKLTLLPAFSDKTIGFALNYQLR
jgi:membrane-associated phospholipid phosphatase